MQTTKMRRIKLGSALACAGVLSVVLFAAPAGAATPAVQGCVGSTLSPLASFAKSADPGLFGHGVVEIAQSNATGQPGLGPSIQLLQAGVVPDSALPNTCNG